MTKILFLFTALSILSNLLMDNFVRAQASVSINPNFIYVTNQNTVSVDVLISNVSNLNSYSVKIIFNNEVLSVQNISQGSFLNQNGAGTFFGTQPTHIQNFFTVNEAILGSDPPVSGAGTLFSITFQIQAAGISNILVDNVLLRDKSNNSIPVIWSSGEINVPLSLSSLVFLEGPFNNGTMKMNTTLNQAGIVPNFQPFNISPYNYTGNENVNDNFFINHPNIVDWILIELRTTPNPSSMVEKKAAFLIDNGQIIDIDGSPLIYLVQATGYYYLVIWTRNHLPVMSKNSIFLDRINSTYNFTLSPNMAYGLNPMKKLGSVYGLFSGDTNSDFQINASDRASTWNNRNFIGYSAEDVNLDGQINASDRAITWNNRNRVFQFP